MQTIFCTVVNKFAYLWVGVSGIANSIIFTAEIVYLLETRKDEKVKHLCLKFNRILEVGRNLFDELQGFRVGSTVVLAELVVLPPVVVESLNYLNIELI